MKTEKLGGVAGGEGECGDDVAGWLVRERLSLASVKSRLVLPFWYRLTWVVPDKGLLNGCVLVL